MTHALTRFGLFALLWLVLMPSLLWYDLLIGLLAVLAATWVSLRLLPPTQGSIGLLALLMLMPRLVWQSVMAGWEVAWRAFHPKMPLAPGFITYPTALEPGLARNTFATLTSLLPGSLACEHTEEGIVYHVLDIHQAHLEQLASEESRLAGVLPPARSTP